MILHTIVSEYDIIYNSESEQRPQFQNISGGMLEYKIYNGEKQITRLHSTNPYLYLKNDYLPYSLIK